MSPLTRRHFCHQLATALGAALGGVGVSSAALPQQTVGPLRLLSAGRRLNDGGTTLLTAEFDGRHAEPTVRVFDADFRGHGVVQHPSDPSTLLMFARRPGFKALRVDLENGAVDSAFHLGKDRQAFGHGVFSADGKLLYSCEGEITSGRGLICVRETDGFTLLDEWDSGGIGPHELVWMPDDRTLAIANGGLLTRPESGREVLNLDTMASNLSYLDTDSGAVIETAPSPHPRASIRHLDVSKSGFVALGMQFQRLPKDHGEAAPLVARHRRGEGIRPLAIPDAVNAACDDYIGSVQISSTGQHAAFSSPRGDLVITADLKAGTFQGFHILHDVCGIGTIPQTDRFLLTNSQGQGRIIEGGDASEVADTRFHTPGLGWDNHVEIAPRAAASATV
ncbi:MAG: DUF1513 domain-containing protein [Pseudomonadota bacterium]